MRLLAALAAVLLLAACGGGGDPDTAACREFRQVVSENPDLTRGQLYDRLVEVRDMAGDGQLRLATEAMVQASDPYDDAALADAVDWADDLCTDLGV